MESNTTEIKSEAEGTIPTEGIGNIAHVDVRVALNQWCPSICSYHLLPFEKKYLQ
jgi:hypothetical protein